MGRGPVEVLFVTFPRRQEVRRVVAALRKPVDDGHVRVIDLILFERADDGTLEVRDVEDELWPGPALADLRLEPHRLLSDADVRLLTESLAEDRQGVAVVVEHTWSRVAGESLRGLDAEVGLYALVPTDVVDAAFAADALGGDPGDPGDPGDER